MKISQHWLREILDNSVIENLEEKLTQLGLEASPAVPVATNFSQVVIGEVLTTERHPNAERLSVCVVNVGKDEPLQIVCGANNVRAGLKVPVALIGAKLSETITIKPTKLRGIDSNGMICSTSELGLTQESTGIMELPSDAPIGKDIREYLDLDDSVIEIELTANRGDCLSHLGIAREISAVIPRFPSAVIPRESGKSILNVEITTPTDCPRYLGRMIENINLVDAQTPILMQERLRRCGMRSINPVVDIMNYVMLELGQPLHAFDAAKIRGGITVRRAKSNETILTLDEQNLTLTDDTLVIADQQYVLAIAGIMGGLDSGVTNQTTNLFLESAFFNQRTLANKARQYNIQSEAAYRFERGVDYELPRRAIERATTLLLEIVGGQVGPIIDKTSEEHLPIVSPIILRQARVERVLGCNIDKNKMKNTLEKLDMTLQHTETGWKVIPPSYRFDLRLEIDLIEEIARVLGYDQLPSHLPVLQPTVTLSSESVLTIERIKTLLVDRGYHEAITYSFVSPQLQQYFDPDRSTLVLANPISEELSVMRTTLWPSLVSSAIYNQNRQQDRILLFEIGTRFIQSGQEQEEQTVLSGLISGPVAPEQWGVVMRPADFFDLKGDIEALFNLTGRAQDFIFKSSQHPALHPGQQMAIQYENNNVGYMGVLHPKLARQFDLNPKYPVILFELVLEYLQKSALPTMTSFSKFPMIRRDLAIVADKQITAQQIQICIQKQTTDFLEAIQLFDVYEGPGIETGKKSIAIGLSLRHPTRTLVDEEVSRWIEQVITVLKDELNIVLRG